MGLGRESKKENENREPRRSYTCVGAPRRIKERNQSSHWRNVIHSKYPLTGFLNL